MGKQNPSKLSQYDDEYEVEFVRRPKKPVKKVASDDFIELDHHSMQKSRINDRRRNKQKYKDKYRHNDWDYE